MGGVVRALLVALGAGASACSFADRDAADPTYTPLWLLSDGKSYLGVTRGEELVAVDVERGRRWTFALPADTDAFYGQRQHVVCTPFSLGDSLVVRSEVELMILSEASGRLKYRARAERESRFGAKSCPTPAGDSAFLVTTDGGRRLVKARPDGTEVWAVRLPDGAFAIGPARATGNGDVVVRAGDRLIVWSGDGQQKWSRKLSDYEE
jgi:outer membrane protein assembly factor BamB